MNPCMQQGLVESLSRLPLVECVIYEAKWLLVLSVLPSGKFCI